MAYSQQDVVRAIVAKLSALGSGQDPNPEDAARVEALLPGVVAELSGLNIDYIPDAENVPDAAFMSLVAYAAEAIAPEFLRPTDAAAQKAAENKLRTLQRIGRGTGQPLKVDIALRPRRYMWGGGGRY